MSRRPNNTRTRSRLQRRDERDAARPDSQAPRQRRARQKQNVSPAGGRFGSIPTTTLAAIGGVIAIAAILIYAVLQAGNSGDGMTSAQRAEQDDNPALPGEYVPPHPGPDGQFGTGNERQHVAPGTVIPICTEEQLESGDYTDPLCYHSNPPTSGPHSSSPMGFAILENCAPKENLVHTMEHGAVIVWHNTSNEEAIRLLEDVVQDNLDRRRLVTMSCYREMEEETIALTSWTRLDKFSVEELTRERVQRFISEHQRRFNPEGF